MTNAFSGKRIRQDKAKLKKIRSRERRLRKIGLSVLSFAHPINWVEYFKIRNEYANKAKPKKAEV